MILFAPLACLAYRVMHFCSLPVRHPRQTCEDKAMSADTFFWHDYETSGTDPFRDRIWQFAGIRTDLNLDPVGDSVSIMCKPSHDNLPHPEACLVTGITPQQAEREGMNEAEFAAAVHEQLGQPGTCGVGYNSLRFDDNFTRNLLYRNFYDPYAREWQDGNSRWDIIDLARMCHALRPADIQWPLRDDGAPSFRLEDLAAANKLDHRRAHDALSDVETTIALARLLKTRQPRLWDWYLRLRNKRVAADLLDIPGRTPVLHVSAKYPASRGCTTLVAPLAQHPARSGEIIVYDLSVDPTELLSLDADDIVDRVFTARDDLPEGVDRVALRTVRTNRSPALAPMSVLKGVDTDRIGLDVDTCLRHAARLRAIPDLAGKVRQVYAAQRDMGKAADPELAIYDGFLPNADKPLLQQVRGTPPEELAEAAIAFRDPRYATLLFRYRARNWPHTLDPDEAREWHDFARQRLGTRSEATSLCLTDYFATLTALRETRPASDSALLDRLQAWGMSLADEFGIDPETRIDAA